MDHSSDEEHWCNPPPPTQSSGYEFDNSTRKSDKESSPDIDQPRLIDRIDPYLKNPEYIKYERRLRSERRRSRSRSHHHSRRRYRSRSRSKGKHKHHRRRHHSSSRSRSRSRSYSRNRRTNRKRSRYSKSCSRSRTRSRSRSKSHHRTHKSHRTEQVKRRRSYSNERHYDPHINDDYYDKIDKLKQTQDENVEEEEEEEEEEEPVNENVFKNDGSFMEMFKKMQEEMKKKEAEKTNTTSIVGVINENKQPLPPVFGKRRGGKVLKTGMVQKNKNTGSDDMNDNQDAWTLYMKEVKRYKEACCDDDSKTRLLVK